MEDCCGGSGFALDGAVEQGLLSGIWHKFSRLGDQRLTYLVDRGSPPDHVNVYHLQISMLTTYPRVQLSVYD